MAYNGSGEHTSENLDRHLKIDDRLDSHLKPIKIGEDQSGLQLGGKDAKVENNLDIGGKMITGGDLTAGSDLGVRGDATITGDVVVTGDLAVNGDDITTDGDMNLDSGGSLTLDAHDGSFIAKIAGTEFSATNSAYAGMILGYTCVGANVADDSYTLTTSYACFLDSGASAIASTFKTPPSENVEIEVELYYSAGGGASDLFLSLSDNATYGSNTLTNASQFEKVVSTPARGNGGTITQKFFIQDDNLSAVGQLNTIYIAAKTDSTSGTPIIKWGGDASGDYTNLVMKTTALPATIRVGS